MKNKGMTVIEALVGLAICVIIVTMAVTFFMNNKFKVGDKVMLHGSGDNGVIMSRLTDMEGNVTYSILVKEPKTYSIILSSKDFSEYEGVERE